MERQILPTHSNRAFNLGDELPDAGTHSSSPTESLHSQRTETSVKKKALSNNRYSGWLTKQLSSQRGCGNNPFGRVANLSTLVLLAWLLLFVLFGAEALPQGGVFRLLTLFLLAGLVGKVMEMIGLPAPLGMLLTGIVMRTTDLYFSTGGYIQFANSLRAVSLGVILIEAGLGLDPVALLKLSSTVILLCVLPGLMEVVSVAVLTHYLIDYPWVWGLALGFVMCAISPEVVIPTLLKLRKEGYGEDKGISTMVIVASSVVDVLAISSFTICVNIIFSTGKSVATHLMRGPLVVITGLTAGALWGLVSGLTPHLEDEHLIWKRVVMLGGAGLCAVIGTSRLEYPGIGPLFCITAAFVASVVWSLQGWPIGTSPVEEVFSCVRYFLQPVLFSLIGAEIDLKMLQLESVALGAIIISASLGVRAVTCSLVLAGGKLNFKEVVFVNLSYLPKATVQAAFAPLVLNMVKKMAHPLPHDFKRGSEFLTIAVMTILITAPLSSIGANLAAPRLLAKASAHTKPQEVDHRL